MELRVIRFQAGVLLAAALNDSSGVPLAGKTIKFYGSNSSSGDWTLLGSSATDDTGVATYLASVYSFYYAEFPGDDDYEPSASSVVPYVAPSPSPSPSPGPEPSPSPPPSSIILTEIELSAYPYGDRVKLVAVLTDEHGVRLPVMPIDFYYGDSEGGPWHPIGQIYTDDNGTASIVTDAHSWYAAEFPGNDTYRGTFAVIQYSPSPSPIPSPLPGPSPSPSPSPLPSPSPSPSPGECCDFADFGCWFFQQGKCVKMFDTVVDSMATSILLVAIALMFLILIIQL